ncbi:MAG TPA: glycosyltransferase [Clostridiales bacterium]|nr:glycosyltransferase [Clostridiales bacterium]
MEKISVIVPIYNAENTLEYCLDSIISQSYSNLEILLINDGSQDSGLSICKRYQAKDSRIRVLDTENQGVSKARNEGLEIAQGTYIGFVDSDDWIDNDMFQKLYDGIKSDLNHCMSVIGVHAEGWKEYLQALCGKKPECTISVPQAIDEVTKRRGLRGYLWNKLFLNTHLLLDENYIVCEDLEFVVRYLLQFPRKSVHILNSKGYHYLISENHDFAHLGYGFSKTFTKLATYEKILSYLDESYDKAKLNIKAESCMVSYDLLVYWYSLVTIERGKPPYEDNIPIVTKIFLQYFQQGYALATWREKIKLLGMRHTPFLLVWMLILKRNLTLKIERED